MENGLEGVRGWDAGVPSVCSHFEHLLMKIEYQFARIFTSIEMQTFSADSFQLLYCRINLVPIPTDTISYAFWIRWQWCLVMVEVFLVIM